MGWNFRGRGRRKQRQNKQETGMEGQSKKGRSGDSRGGTGLSKWVPLLPYYIHTCVGVGNSFRRILLFLIPFTFKISSSVYLIFSKAVGVALLRNNCSKVKNTSMNLSKILFTWISNHISLFSAPFSAL